MERQRNTSMMKVQQRMAGLRGSLFGRTASDDVPWWGSNTSYLVAIERQLSHHTL